MAARTVEQRRRRAETERRRYTKKRVAVLRAVLPDLPPDVLERANLRHVSVCVRRAGGGQGAPSASKELDTSSGPLSKELLEGIP